VGLVVINHVRVNQKGNNMKDLLLSLINITIGVLGVVFLYATTHESTLSRNFNKTVDAKA
jgi:hypothetical protein